jgi:hypothetical protein
MLLVLAGLSLLIAVTRLRTYSAPLDWDIGTYAVIAHELNHGRRLYAEVWDMKPPAIFATYQVAEWMAGYGYGQIYLLGTLCAILTMLGVYTAGSAFGPGAGLFAASCFAVVQSDLGLEANRPNTEAFMNACAAWSFALLLRNPNLGAQVVIGVLVGLGSLYKQVAVAVMAAVIIAHAIMNRARRGWMGAITIALSFAMTWFAVWVYFAATGRAEIFWKTIFEYPRFYASTGGEREWTVLPGILVAILPAAFMLILGLLVGWKQQDARRLWILLLFLIVGTQIAIALPRQFFAHYFQLWLVPASIGAGWGLSVLQALPRRWISVACGVVVLGGLVFLQIPSYRLSARKWTIRQHGNVLTEWLLPVAEELDSSLHPDEAFYQWANEPWLYFATRRRPPGAALWRSHTIEGPVAEWLTHRTLADLQRARPRIIVVWDGSEGPADHPISRWIYENYAPQRGARHRYPLLFFVRREPS